MGGGRGVFLLVLNLLVSSVISCEGVTCSSTRHRQKSGGVISSVTVLFSAIMHHHQTIILFLIRSTCMGIYIITAHNGAENHLVQYGTGNRAESLNRRPPDDSGPGRRARRRRTSRSIGPSDRCLHRRGRRPRRRSIFLHRRRYAPSVWRRSARNIFLRRHRLDRLKRQKDHQENGRAWEDPAAVYRKWRKRHRHLPRQSPLATPVPPRKCSGQGG